MIELDGKKYYISKEFGVKIGKSRQTINSWIKNGRLPAAYIKQHGGYSYISEDALTDTAVLCGSTGEQTPENGSKPCKQGANASKSEASTCKQDANSGAQSDFTSYLLGEIDRLRAELEAKDVMIADLRSQLDAHTERLAAITEESQRLVLLSLETTKNAQTLQAASMLPPPAADDPAAVEAEPEPDVIGYDAGGGSWFRRIFGKK